MKSNTIDFRYNQKLEQIQNDEIKNYKTNIEYIKNDNSINVIDKPIQNTLKDFISNVKKFNFSSAFDRKGAKSFLKSKGKALQEIDLNENILEENDLKVKKYKKEEEIRKKNASSKIIRKELKDKMISYNQKVYSMKTIQKLGNEIFENKNKEKIKKSKSKYKKKKPGSCKINHYKLTNYINKGINNDNKKLSKFNSEIELKMKSDKNLRKLKPIKKSRFTMNNNYNDNGNFCTFVRSESSKTDSTLFHLVSEFDK